MRPALRALFLLTILAAVVAAACTSSAPGGTVKAIWLAPESIEVSEGSLSIPAEQVLAGRIIHFGATGADGDKMNFMAYMHTGEIFIRANLCPPCRSVGFSLSGDILICDSCNTRFQAGTGNGISGACRDYPKAAVPFTTTEGRIFMEIEGLTTAYVETGELGWP